MPAALYHFMGHGLRIPISAALDGFASITRDLVRGVHMHISVLKILLQPLWVAVGGSIPSKIDGVQLGTAVSDPVISE